MKHRLVHGFDKIVSLENLFTAWEEFLEDKKKKEDVRLFALHLSDNIFQLREDLLNQTYRHGGYESFFISDPKPRHIHKASVMDRLLHHALHRQLYPFFDRKFIADSYSCRLDKGTHRALNRFTNYSRKVSCNNTKACWVLKCDIKKFFANIDHAVLKTVLVNHIADTKILWLLDEIISGFSLTPGKGLPLGNLTSQLLVNIYMNEFDQYMKNSLKIKFYIRYADDFVILSDGRRELEELVIVIAKFLESTLKLQLHPNKVSIQTVASGVDFLGWVHFPRHMVLRTATKKRMMRRIVENPTEETYRSYLGLLQHGNAHNLRKGLSNTYVLYRPKKEL
jgi:retron-type reverse transcriptase